MHGAKLPPPQDPFPPKLTVTLILNSLEWTFRCRWTAILMVTYCSAHLLQRLSDLKQNSTQKDTIFWHSFQ